MVEREKKGGKKNSKNIEEKRGNKNKNDLEEKKSKFNNDDFDYNRIEESEFRAGGRGGGGKSGGSGGGGGDGDNEFIPGGKQTRAGVGGKASASHNFKE